MSLRLFLRRLALFALLRLGLFGGVCFCFDFVRLNHDIFVLGRVRVIPVNLTSRLLHGRSCAPVESLFVCGKDIVIVAVNVYLLKKSYFSISLILFSDSLPSFTGGFELFKSGLAALPFSS